MELTLKQTEINNSIRVLLVPETKKLFERRDYNENAIFLRKIQLFHSYDFHTEDEIT